MQWFLDQWIIRRLLRNELLLAIECLIFQWTKSINPSSIYEVKSTSTSLAIYLEQSHRINREILSQSSQQMTDSLFCLAHSNMFLFLFVKAFYHQSLDTFTKSHQMFSDVTFIQKYQLIIHSFLCHREGKSIIFWPKDSSPLDSWALNLQVTGQKRQIKILSFESFLMKKHESFQNDQKLHIREWRLESFDESY